MNLEQIKGNADVVKALSGMIESSRVPHAILFYEEDGGGAMPLCLAFLQKLFAEENRIPKLIHPDVHFVFPVSGGSCEGFLGKWRELVISRPHFLEKDLLSALGIEGKTPIINVDEAKKLSADLSMSALEGGWRAVVIYLPEKMNETAANKLLKLIEEPPAATQFLLITHAPDKVLQTIASRCQAIRVAPLSKGEVSEVLQSQYSVPAEDAADAAASAAGSIGRALDYLAAQQCTPEEESLFRAIMEAIASKDLSQALSVAENLPALPSRENAKAFCKFASEQIRKVFLVQQRLDTLAGLSLRDREFVQGMASRARKTFPRAALPLLDNARYMIERNINLKVLFTDLVCKLYRIF